MFHDLRIVDSDGHTLEPPDLFERYLDKKFVHRVEQSGHGLSIDGHETALHPPGTLETLRFTPDLILERYGSLAAEGFTAEGVVNALDVEGIDVSVIYGPLYPCWIEGMDPELACALARAYSRWLAQYSADSGGRIVGAAPIPLHSIEGALAELSYAHEQLGINAAWTRPNPVGGRPLGAPEFDPFFEALADQKIPLSLHEGSGSMMQNIGSERFTETWFEQHACVHPMEQQMAMLSLIVQGVFERHPTLRVAFLESGAAWLPSWLHRLDEHAELVAWREAPYLSLKPSDYFRQSCFISCDPDDELLYQVIEALGDDRIVFATDFPHPDAKYPNAVKSFMGLPKVTVESQRKILWDNAVAFYGPVVERSLA